MYIKKDEIRVFHKYIFSDNFIFLKFIIIDTITDLTKFMPYHQMQYQNKSLRQILDSKR